MMVFFIGVALIGGIVIGNHTVPKKEAIVIEQPTVLQVQHDQFIIQNLAQ